MVGDGDLTEKQRNNLLAKMTGEVSSLVLYDNYLQTRRSPWFAHGVEDLDDQMRLMRMLDEERPVKQGGRVPAPSDEALNEPAAAGREHRRLAILLSYSKIWLLTR